MKKILIIAIALMASVTYASAQAKIKFDKTTHNFGKFEESENSMPPSRSPTQATSHWSSIR